MASLFGPNDTKLHTILTTVFVLGNVGKNPALTDED